MKLHKFEFSTLAAQQRAFSRAEIIVGAHGTAFSGLAFARQGVAVVEWGLARDSYSTAEYLGLDATYFQLQPKWSRNATVAECAATGLMDDCPWHLDADDVRRYLALVDELVRDKGAALLAPARGARVTSPSTSSGSARRHCAWVRDCVGMHGRCRSRHITY